MTCLVIDDEPLAIKILEKYLQDQPDWTLVKTFSDPMAGLHFLRKQTVDLLFLDINMPDLSGLHLLRTLPHPPLTILTTAYPEYAVESYEFEVVDYLLKPFSLPRFLQALQKAESRLQPTPGHDQFLSVRADRKLHRLPHEDIYVLQAFGDYVKINTREGTLAPKTTLSELEQRLPGPPFMRVHRAWIVNRNYVEYLEGNQVMVQQTAVPVSKAYREEVVRWLERG